MSPISIGGVYITYFNLGGWGLSPISGGSKIFQACDPSIYFWNSLHLKLDKYCSCYPKVIRHMRCTFHVPVHHTSLRA